MSRLQSVAILAISMVLVAQFVVTEVRPRLYSAALESAYATAAAGCQISLSALGAKSNAGVGESTQFGADLQLSLRIELVACHELDLLRSQLLASGVHEEGLRAICLSALEDERVSIEPLGATTGACWR